MTRLQAVLFDFDGVLLDSYKKLTMKRFVSFFKKQTSDTDLPLVPGMEKVISDLSKKYRLAIISSSSTGTIQNFLREHQLEKYFGAIHGYEAGDSKAEKTKEYLLENNLPPERCIFVTDTTGDIHEAHIAGVPAVGVTWGYHTKQDLLGAEPEAVLEKPGDIVKFINNC